MFNPSAQNGTFEVLLATKYALDSVLPKKCRDEFGEGCTDTVQITVEVAQGARSLEELVQVFPNPSTGLFQLN